MPYAIGDRVQVSVAYADRGASAGWTGTITEYVGGPQAAGSYRVTRPYGTGPEQGDAVVPAQNIVAGPLVAAGPFVVGQSVVLAGMAGVIRAITAAGLAEVEIVVELTRRRWERRGRRVPLGQVVYTRLHRVPLWRLGLEN